MTLPYGTEHPGVGAWIDEEGTVHYDDAVARNGQGVDTPDDEPDTWAPVDLAPYLDGTVTRPEPTVGLARSDGLRLLYPGKEHAVIGEMEAGKSWVATAGVMVELLAGKNVVYIHFEESDPTDTVERLRALGVPAGVIVSRLRFVGPERPVTPAVLAALLDPAPSLVVLDGINEGMSLHAAEIMGPDGAATFRRRLVKPCTRAGAAVLSCDHVVKDPERRGRGLALGSVHKGNALSGSLILLENAEPFGRSMRGRSHVFVTKDRPGHLRRHGQPTRVPQRTYLGELVVDDSQAVSPDLTLRFWAPRDDEPAPSGGAADGLRDAEIEAAIVEVIAAEPNRIVESERRLFAAMRKAGKPYRDVDMRRALDDLEAGHVVARVSGSRGAKGFRVVAPDVAQTDTGEAS